MDGSYTLQTPLTPEEADRRDQLIVLMKGNAISEKHSADANHLFQAYKYGGGYFITHDMRIHKFAGKISLCVPGVTIVTLVRFVEICRGVAENERNRI